MIDYLIETYNNFKNTIFLPDFSKKKEFLSLPLPKNKKKTHPSILFFLRGKNPLLSYFTQPKMSRKFLSMSSMTFSRTWGVSVMYSLLFPILSDASLAVTW